MTDNITLDYYDQNAGKFVSGTVDADMHKVQDTFLGYLKSGARILDFGCGSGRDTKYFLEQGFAVDAMDGSAQLCALAGKLTGIPVKQMLFSDLDADSVYDGIWACASVLHLEYEPLGDVFHKMIRALKQGGCLYVSFKYGSFQGMRSGRYFTDMTEERFQAFVSAFPELKIEKMCVTADARPERNDEKWLNILLIKCCQNPR